MSKTKAGKFKFNLKASNGQVVGTSQSYTTESACDNGVKCVAKDAPKAVVEDNS